MGSQNSNPRMVSLRFRQWMEDGGDWNNDRPTWRWQVYSGINIILHCFLW